MYDIYNNLYIIYEIYKINKIHHLYIYIYLYKFFLLFLNNRGFNL